MNLFTIIIKKKGHPLVILQEDTESAIMAMQNAIGRMPSNYPNDEELSLFDSFLNDMKLIKLIKDSRLHNTWYWPNNESSFSSLKIVIIKTSIENENT